MTYDPSLNAGSKAIQIDTNGASTISPDFTTHTTTDFLASNAYLLEQRRYIQTVGSATGLIIFSTWSTNPFLGGIIRCNSITGLSTITDNATVGVISPGVAFTRTDVTSGSETVASSTTYTALWRI